MLTGSLSAIRFGVILGSSLLALSVASLRAWRSGSSHAAFLKGQAGQFFLFIFKVPFDNSLDRKIMLLRSSLVFFSTTMLEVGTRDLARIVFQDMQCLVQVASKMKPLELHPRDFSESTKLLMVDFIMQHGWYHLGNLLVVIFLLIIFSRRNMQCFPDRTWLS